jgi:hypothetical protein
MRTTIIRLLIAAAFGTAAWLSWSESRLITRVADARQSIATFDFRATNGLQPSRALSDYQPGDRRRLSDDIRIAKAKVAYWLGRYDVVAADSGGAADSDILLTAANAAYRVNMRDLGTGPAAAQKLDGVLQAYAAAMKTSARNIEAAYNYEFVARLRDQVARAPQGKAAKATSPGGPIIGGDQPAGPTKHRSPGAPPPDAKTEEFKTIMPMEYGDREGQAEATPGASRERKG